MSPDTNNATLTYAEQQHHKTFDWREWLLAMRVQGPKNGEWYGKRQKAMSWITCATGNQCNIIPRHASGEPVDVVLEQLGIMFYDAIKEQEADWALSILNHIEERSAVLIAQIKAQPQP